MGLAAHRKTRYRLVFGTAVTNEGTGRHHATGENMAELSESSRAYTVALDEGVQGRLWTSMGAEWRVGLNNANTFARVVLALSCGNKTCLAVTMTVEIETVMCFYDTEHRLYASQCVGIAIATDVGGWRWKWGRELGRWIREEEGSIGGTDGI